MMSCDKCGGQGKLSYRTLPSNPDPVDIGNGTMVQDMGGWGARPCSCVKDLPAIEGRATWWETESIYSEVVAVPVGDECIELVADCEVPRDDDGRRVHRTGPNVWYPCMIRMDAPSHGVTLLPDDARELAKALVAAADVCDERDQPAFASMNQETWDDIPF